MSQVQCKYYYFDTVDEFFGRCANENLTIFHANLRSFAANYDEISVLLDRLHRRPNILVFSETWFGESTCESIVGYTGYHVYRGNRRGGGISIYVSDSMRSYNLQEYSYSNDLLELNTVRISLGTSNNITIVGIYRPPEIVKIPEFNNHINHLLTSFHKSMPVYIVGDINIDILQEGVRQSDFVDVMHSMSYIPLITMPTRVTNNTATLLDHIWTNQLHEARTGILNISTTDHFPTFASTIFPVHSNKSSIKKVFRDHSDQAVNKMLSGCQAFLRYFDQFSSLNTESRVNIFQERIYQLYNDNCRLCVKQVSLKGCTKPWITDEIKRLINRKHLLFRRFKEGLIHFDVYNYHKNLCTKTIKRSKEDFFKRKFDMCRGNLRKTWNNLRYLMNAKTNCNTIKMLRYKGAELLQADDIAEAFSKYFANVATELDKSIPQVCNKTPSDYLCNPVLNSFFASPSTSAEVSAVIKSFQTKGGYAKWTPVYIFKRLCNLISEPISDLFNSSIIDGCFPNCLKLARVVPIFKAGCRSEVSDYRPISTLPVMSKIFEKLMYRRLTAFLTDNNILVGHQFGFQTGSSTDDAVLEFLDRVYKSLEEGKFIMPVYLDFSKAFDTVNHRILLSKIEHYGIRGIMGSWFKSYLQNRKQYVSVNGVTSAVSTMNMGVPQGSVLGPALFLLYINDMSTSTTLDLIHFADDTTIVASTDTEHNLFTIMNRELSSVDKWLKVNRLSLNIKKTKYMIITNKATLSNRKIRIRRRVIEKINCIKFLGIMLDDRLNFDRHALHICNKVARAVGVINRISHHLSFPQLINLYYSIIYPHLIYCVTVWGRVGSTGVGRVQRVQRRAVKVISRHEVNHSAVTNKLMNMNSIYNYFTSIKLYKVLKENQHSYFFDKVIDAQIDHDHATRFKINSCLTAPFFRKAKCQHAFVYQSVTIWNAIPPNVRNCNTLSNFRKLLKTFIISEQEPILT